MIHVIRAKQIDISCPALLIQANRRRTVYDTGYIDIKLMMYLTAGNIPRV